MASMLPASEVGFWRLDRRYHSLVRLFIPSFLWWLLTAPVPRLSAVRLTRKDEKEQAGGLQSEKGAAAAHNAPSQPSFILNYQPLKQTQGACRWGARPPSRQVPDWVPLFLETRPPPKRLNVPFADDVQQPQLFCSCLSAGSHSRRAWRARSLNGMRDQKLSGFPSRCWLGTGHGDTGL